MASVPSSTAPAVTIDDNDPLEIASQAVDQALIKDRTFADLASLLQVQGHTQPTISGRMDADYPSFSDQRMSLAMESQIGHIQKVPLPTELVEQFGHMQCNCMMGIFPDIHRSWLTVDSDIFVWNYQDGSDLAYFDGLSETILSVGCIKPRKGIFQPHIEYLLCLTTPVDIVLLGVSFSQPSGEHGFGPDSEMHLLPEPLFCLPTDNVQMLQVMGTVNGRIFLTGRDGCLYEILYQATDGWFSRKCKKVNHSTSHFAFLVPSFLNVTFSEEDPLVQISVDESRRLLYTRSEKGTIQVYDMGADGNGLSRVGAMSQYTMVQTATLIAKTIDKSNFSPVISISPVSIAESEYIHLLAVTHTGIRLYFTTCRFDVSSVAPYSPHLLALVHVRLPPGFSMSSSQQRPCKIHAATYNRGTLAMVGSEGEDKDMLWIISSDALPFQKQLRETADVIPIEGRVWSLSESCQLGSPSLPRSLEPPAVVVQQDVWERRFVLLNSLGSILVPKHLPVSQLRQLLERGGPDSAEVVAFFEVLGEQACVCAVLLACRQSLVDAKIAEMATIAFFKHGSSGEFNLNSSLHVTNLGPSHQSFVGGANSFQYQPASPGFSPVQMSTPFPGRVAQQLNFSNSTIMPVALPQNFSPRYTGLCLYLGRVLRSLWEMRMVADFSAQKSGKKHQQVLLCSKVEAGEVAAVLVRLNDLRNFMRRCSQFVSPLVAESYSAAHSQLQPVLQSRTLGEDQLRKKQQVELDTQESAALRRLGELLSRCCECLSLWKILCDHQFHVLAQNLSQEQQNFLRLLTLRTLLTNGKEVCGQLITCLINLYIDDNAATDAISQRLREVCPALYSQEDAVCSKANEMLLTARSVPNKLERDQQLGEALNLYKQISTRLNLPLVTADFRNAQFFTGIVDLVVTAAGRRDPQNLALHFFKSGEQPEDSVGATAYATRVDCYNCVLDTLDHLLAISQTHPGGPCVPMKAGPPPAPDPNKLSAAEAERFAEEVFSLCVKSEDEMFHMILYDWLLNSNMPEKLLEIQSPYLESYLKRRVANEPDQLPIIDLLWKFYEKNNNFSAAARILSKLADQGLIALNLAQRMEYLSRATMSAKGSTQSGPRGSEGEFLHQLEEKMDVAKIQSKIFDALINSNDVTGDQLKRLNSQLFDITTLFTDFTDPYGLYECSLAILHCAGHNDTALVQSLWLNMVNQEIRLSRANGREVVINNIRQKLVELGKLYANSERYFPLAFLIKYLEQKSCELRLYEVNVNFVVQTLQEIGLTLPKLLEMYDRLIKSRDPCWTVVHRPLHLLHVVHNLLLIFAEQPKSVATYERRHFTLVCQDAVSSYLIELQSSSTMGSASTDDRQTLISTFKDLHARLERMSDTV